MIGTLTDNSLIRSKYKSVADGEKQGYIIDVTETDDGNVITIAGNTPQGVYYGIADFLGEYLPTVAVKLTTNGNFNLDGVFNAPFNKIMPAYSRESAPAIKNRAIWTWGHCIFDYKKFFDNMALLKLNEIVIWNDSMPINAKQVVKYAHGMGIRVIFGFAWGWDTDCGAFDIKECFIEKRVKTFAGEVVEYYEKNVLPTGADGIYFQSFTELSADNIGGVNVAQAVTAWVNGIAEEIYAKYPHIELQFGLHATSVKEHLTYLKAVDKRIKIVWEDCGAFPYNYSPSAVENYCETEVLTNEMLSLRGESEKFGAVFKGMTTLYWDKFKHIDSPFVLGKSTKKTVDEVYEDRKPAWKYIQAEWIKNAEYVRKTARNIEGKTKGETDIQLLVEYGAFEKEIFFPVALAAAILWNPDENVNGLIEKTALNPAVKFVNL